MIDELEGLFGSGSAEGTDVRVVIPVLGIEVKTWTRYIGIMLGNCVMVFVFSCGISMVTNMADVERLWGKKIKKKYQQIFTRFHCHSDLH